MGRAEASWPHFCTKFEVLLVKVMGWVLQGGCLVVLGHKMKDYESLGKGVFCPLAPRGMGSVGSVLHYSEESDSQCFKTGDKSVLG